MQVTEVLGMPVYTYKCDQCDHQFEVRQRYSDAPLTECSRCGGRIRRLIVPVGVVFKGSGFYVTDNRNGKANGYLNGKGSRDGSANSESEGATKNKEKSDSAPSSSAGESS
jgi:putative FmdB family regulatory protein